MSYKYKPIPAKHIVFKLLRYAIEDRTYVSVLDVLADGIKAVGGKIEQAGVPDEFFDHFEEEIQIIEGLLGVAYVVCQVQITAITKAARDCRDQAERDDLPLPPFGKTHFDVRNFGATFLGQHSKIEVLWQLANYFKHRDQWWSETWTKPDDREKSTISVITAIGLKQGSTGNLRTGAEALGNVDYSKMEIFEDIISDWANQVGEAARHALGL
jgi:hypothetical protein